MKEINKGVFVSLVITNQTVIVRGESSFDQLREINNKIETLVGKNGAYFDELFFCSHHSDKGFEDEIPSLKFGAITENQRMYSCYMSKKNIILI